MDDARPQLDDRLTLNRVSVVEACRTVFDGPYNPIDANEALALRPVLQIFDAGLRGDVYVSANDSAAIVFVARHPHHRAKLQP